jgi:hypothetical protein
MPVLLDTYWGVFGSLMIMPGDFDLFVWIHSYMEFCLSNSGDYSKGKQSKSWKEDRSDNFWNWNWQATLPVITSCAEKIKSVPFRNGDNALILKNHAVPQSFDPNF